MTNVVHLHTCDLYAGCLPAAVIGSVNSSVGLPSVNSSVALLERFTRPCRVAASSVWVYRGFMCAPLNVQGYFALVGDCSVLWFPGVTGLVICSHYVTRR